ncbi:CRISPR-associated protein Cas5 [Streptomyces albus]|uniref:CRISPR-associated protein Cas5 n=1 Tax=Streptomyces albus TaxID=1888 RepID=UPI00099E3500|nr:CRISPR-associated protein Cas5 [Streptomyces albus]
MSRSAEAARPAAADGAPGTSTGGVLRAWRAQFHAPVASFKDPLFPGLSHGLPVPPPSTVRGLLAAASGRVAENSPVGIAAWSEGSGVDMETYHPIGADGTNPAVAGRVRAGKGGMTIRDRPFRADVHLVVWLPDPEGRRLAEALRRPRWPLRLGRSQDLVHPLGVREVTLRPAEHAVVGHALAPSGGHEAPEAMPYRLAASITPDRMTTHLADYLWSETPVGLSRVHGAWSEEDSGKQAVWLLEP